MPTLIRSTPISPVHVVEASSGGAYTTLCNRHLTVPFVVRDTQAPITCKTCAKRAEAAGLRGLK